MSYLVENPEDRFSRDVANMVEFVTCVKDTAYKDHLSTNTNLDSSHQDPLSTKIILGLPKFRYTITCLPITLMSSRDQQI